MAKKKKDKVVQKPRRVTRKEMRKEQRQLKKQAKCHYFEEKRNKLNNSSPKKSLDNSTLEKSSTGNQAKGKLLNVPSKQNKDSQFQDKDINHAKGSSKKKSYDHLMSKMKDQRKRQLLDANKDEDKEIQFLEKRLKLANKKAVSTSKAFVESGLDYILDVCDPDKIHNAVRSEVNFDDSDSDFYDDYSLVKNSGSESVSKKHNNFIVSDVNENTDKNKNCHANTSTNPKKVRFSSETSQCPTFNQSDSDIASSDEEVNKGDKRFVVDNMKNPKRVSASSKTSHQPNLNPRDSEVASSDEEDPQMSDSEYSDDELGSEASVNNDADPEENSDSPSENEIENKAEAPKKEIWEDIYGRLRDKKGNIIKGNEGKYVPPHLRKNDDSDETKKRKELLRLLKGLLNRLALNNMHSIANQVEELFSKNSRNSMNDALFSLYIDSIVSPVLSPQRLVIDHAMLIAALHANVGSEIGAYMLQNLVQKFNMLLNLSQDVENKELDNILLLISYLYNFKVFEACLMYDILNKLCDQFTEKNVDLILIILKNVGFPLRKDDPIAMKGFLLKVQKQMNQTADVEDRSRMKYMLEILLSIKNNNVSKLSEFDPEQHEHLKKILKSVVRSGNSIVPFKIQLDDLLKAEERGRWWLVGSAWNKGDEEQKVKKDNVPREKFSAQLLELARKQKMNTDNRRNLFCILMSAEDYQDAFEKVLKLGLKGQQEREIPLVILHCLLHEKNYNPYYAHIADQLCISNRRHQMSLQCALWDRFRALDKLNLSQISVLAKFLAQVLLAGSIPLSVLKVVEFTELDKRHIRLIRQTILSLANEEAVDSVTQVFQRVSKSKKLHLFREAMRLFIHHFILRNMPDGTIKDRVVLMNSILVGDVN